MDNKMREPPNQPPIPAWIGQFNSILEVRKLNRNIPSLANLEWHPIVDTYSTHLRLGDKLLLLDTTTDRVYNVVLKAKIFDCVPKQLRLRTYVKGTWESIVAGSVVAKSERSSKATSTIDQEARDVIYGDREQTYGHPSKNVQLIAEFWTSYLKGKEVLTCDDVCNMMILMKTARLKNLPDHRDSLVDTIGYTLLKERCREKQESLTDVLRKAQSDLLDSTKKENHDY